MFPETCVEDPILSVDIECRDDIQDHGVSNTARAASNASSNAVTLEEMQDQLWTKCLVRSGIARRRAASPGC